MLLDLISIILILACVVILSRVVGKRIKAVASINVEALPQEKEASVRQRLLKDRFDRKIVNVKKWLKQAGVPLGKYIVHGIELWNNLYSRLLQLRNQGRLHTTSDSSVMNAIPAQENDPLKFAIHELEEGNLEKAEQAFIEIIRSDPRSKESYRGLSDLYIQKKEYTNAYETLQYLWKLYEKEVGLNAPFRSSVAYDLWDVSMKLEKFDVAKKWIQEALNQEPNNPKFLDAGIETCIILGDRIRAERIFDQLRVSNPENQKILEFQERIQTLSY